MTKGGDFRVLVIDDADEMRSVIRRSLTAYGCQIDDVATIAEARALDPYTYHAVLVDMRIGADRGSDFVREMLAAAPDMAGRCLMITGGGLDAIPDGISSLAKPFGPGQLREAVDALRRAGEGSGRGPSGPSPASAPPREIAMACRQEKIPLSLVRALRMRERRHLADHLHDGAIQEISAAALGLRVTRNGLRAGRGDELEPAIRHVDRAAAAIRGLMEEQEQAAVPLEGTALAPAVRDRIAWLLASPAAVHVHPPEPELTDGQIALVADVAELTLFLLTQDSPRLPARLDIRAVAHGAIRIDAAVTVAGGGDGVPGWQADPAVLRTRLRELAGALAATVRVTRGQEHVRARLTLPPESTSGGNEGSNPHERD
jgi:CheY-like chemotaxis protein